MAEKDWRANDLANGDSISTADVQEFLTIVENIENGILQDADADTKIQVEKSADEDKIRFDTGGIERAVLDSTGLDLASGLTYNIGGTAHNHDTSYISKPSSPNHLDLLAFITSDWANVARSWASGDLLYVKDNSGTLEWQRLGKGTDGQVLTLASGLPSWSNKTKDLFFARYGYTYWDKEVLDTPELVIDDATEYSYRSSIIGYDERDVKSWKLDSKQDSYLTSGHLYYLVWETELKNTAGNVAGHRAFLGTTTTYSNWTYYNTTTTSYATFGNQTSIIKKNGYAYGTALKLYLSDDDYSLNTLTYSRNNKIYVHTQFKAIPVQITSAWLSASGFSGIKYIELYDNGDSVKINNDTDLIFTGVAGQPVGLNKSTANIGFTPEDYEDITQIEVISGNPLIVFEKA